ncbi:MAG: hypothetical protein WCA77_10240 [Thermoplasmata archaeon]
MPQATLSAARLAQRLGRVLTPAELDPVLFRSKVELKRWEGDEMVVEVTPDRLDLLCESGLALYLAGALGSERGLPAIPRDLPGPDAPVIDVDASVDPVRPAVAAVLLRAPEDRPLDVGLLDEAIRFQETLHAAMGRDRRVASLGIYPWARLRSPVRYALERLAELRFVPLDGSETVTGDAFYREHPLARRYGAFGRSGDRALTLRDGNGTLLSLPPVLNTREGGEATSGDQALLLESTGLRSSRVRDMVGLLALVFLSRDWRATPVPIRGEGTEDDGRAVLAPRVVSLTAAGLQRVTGRPWDSAETELFLGQARLGSQPETDGWRVEAAPWRPDILSEVDVIEDVVLERGVRTEDGRLPPSFTRGRRRPESHFRDKVSGLLLGLGFTQLHTPVLTSHALTDRVGRLGAIHLTNPTSELYAVLRDSLQPVLVGVLEHNLRFGYPQRVFEVGPVICRAPASESGAETRVHAATLFAGERAGFADAASIVDYVIRAFGASGIREPQDVAGTIPGRAAVLRVAGERVAEMGELQPAVLSSAGVPVPVAWMEIDLNALWPLVRRARTA